MSYVIVTAGVIVLTLTGTIMNSRSAAAQGPPNGMSVNVVSSVPLHADVSGNVGITGTPNVNVTNPARAPVLALNVDDPGRIPYQSFSVADSCDSIFPICSGLFTAVPSGHRLVAQHFSGAMTFKSPPASFVFVNLASTSTSLYQPFNSFQLTPGDGSEAHFDQSILLYFDPGQQPKATLTFHGTASFDVIYLTLTGYLLDCAIAPCAQIGPPG
jgi:hypothetical protein